MFVTNWISTTKIQKISEITNFFRHYFLSRTDFFADLFPIFNNYYYLCDQISFKHTSNNLKRYINN